MLMGSAPQRCEAMKCLELSLISKKVRSKEHLVALPLHCVCSDEMAAVDITCKSLFLGGCHVKRRLRHKDLHLEPEQSRFRDKKSLTSTIGSIQLQYIKLIYIGFKSL